MLGDVTHAMSAFHYCVQVPERGFTVAVLSHAEDKARYVCEGELISLENPGKALSDDAPEELYTLTNTTGSLMYMAPEVTFYVQSHQRDLWMKCCSCGLGQAHACIYAARCTCALHWPSTLWWELGIYLNMEHQCQLYRWGRHGHQRSPC